jgi:hypothetical protein
MNTFGQGSHQSTSVLQKSINPSVASLLENEEKRFGSNFSPDENDQNLDFANALLNHASKIDGAKNLNNLDIINQQKKEALQKRLNEQTSPINSQEVFSAREKEEEKKLNQTRKELALLATETQSNDLEISNVLSQEIVDPGTEGTYHKNWLHQISLILKKTDRGYNWNEFVNIKGKKKQGLLNYNTTKGVQTSISNEHNSGNNAAG